MNKLLSYSVLRPTRVLNWCNDGEREQFPFLPTSWWLCSEVPGGSQFIMCPSPWPCHWRNRQAHVCMNYQPSHLPNPPSHIVDIWHRGEKTWGIRVCKSIKVYIHFVHQGRKVLRCARSPAEQDYSINHISLNVQYFKLLKTVTISRFWWLLHINLLDMILRN